MPTISGVRIRALVLRTCNPATIAEASVANFVKQSGTLLEQLALCLNNNSGYSGSRLQPLRGDPDNPPPEGTNAIAQARTPQARPSGPAREKNFRSPSPPLKVLTTDPERVLALARVTLG